MHLWCLELGALYFDARPAGPTDPDLHTHSSMGESRVAHTYRAHAYRGSCARSVRPLLPVAASCLLQPYCASGGASVPWRAQGGGGGLAV